MIHVVETWHGASQSIKPYPKGKKPRTVPLEKWVAELLDELALKPSVDCGHEHQVGTSIRWGVAVLGCCFMRRGR